MGKIALAAGFTTGVLILVEVANGWYDLAAASAVVSVGFGCLAWALTRARG